MQEDISQKLSPERREIESGSEDEVAAIDGVWKRQKALTRLFQDNDLMAAFGDENEEAYENANITGDEEFPPCHQEEEAGSSFKIAGSEAQNGTVEEEQEESGGGFEDARAWTLEDSMREAATPPYQS